MSSLMSLGVRTRHFVLLVPHLVSMFGYHTTTVLLLGILHLNGTFKMMEVEKSSRGAHIFCSPRANCSLE